MLIQGPDIHGTFTDGRSFQTYAPSDPTLVQRLYGKGVAITARPQGDSVPWFVSLLVSWLPFIALIGVWIFLSRQMQGAGGKALGFGKSRAKLLTEAHGRVTFEDVAGVDEAKSDLQEIVEFLRDPGKFQRLGGTHSARRAAGRPARHRQDVDRARRRGRSQRAVLHHFRLRLRRDVRRRRRLARARHVRAGQEERALHHLHRRNRRGRPPSRRRPRRRQRRARADAQPVAGRDGRLRGQRRHHPDRRDQPARRARSGAAAPRPLRPPGRRAESGRGRPRADPEGARAQGAARAGRQPEDHRARHAGLLRRRPRQPRQRGRPDGRAAQQAHGHAERVRGRQGQGDDGRRAQVARHDRGREDADRLSRRRPRDPRAQRRRHRSGAQGDHHSARPRARHGHAACRSATSCR